MLVAGVVVEQVILKADDFSGM